ncbi:MAG: DNA polymerase III subunit delta [Sphaerochaeta sp.]|jgi:DNA polymerase-3 subunit delta|nr:DNA polymerase III subunit delta [Sphaerochaeta sp.]MCH3920138.1 DNA polymerase III subunit delta [Sphaerochaeta sp.]MCI2045194.1 DNA polymerase III subunit delta [Sphaerochaeta sp.]MCI2076050.1 DNA polymerase III subunit delta [Sphaerochaeta sp.]MCI2096324.1 DNA polymerase III subunit delta [Sphaerochaeta sp.]
MATPAYLLLGPENGAKQERLQQITDNLKRTVGSQPETYRFHASDLDGDTLYTTLDNNSFFSDHRLVIISDIDVISSSMAAVIGKYLEHPSDQTTLVMESDNTFVKLPQITKHIPKDATIIFWELFDNQKEDWVRNFFRNQGVTITSDAISTLLELIDNDTAEMRTVCSQLALFWQTGKKKGAIDSDAVETYVAHTKNENGYTLFPAIASRDLKQALRILGAILDAGDSGTSFSLHSQLLWQFRRLRSVIRVWQETHNEATAFAQASILGTPYPIRSLREKNSYRAGIRAYTEAEVTSALMALEDADIPIKSAGDMTRLEWERLLFSLITQSGKQPEQPTFLTV